VTRHNIPLGKILGIPIGLDYSWFLIFALLTWMLGSSYYPAEFKNWPPVLYWLMGAVSALMLFASVLLHELGFLDNVASAQVHSVMFQGLLAGHQVSQAMSTHTPDVSADLTLQELVDQHVLGSGQFFVKRRGNIVGLLTMHQIKIS
jgi:hypothetical protein